MIYKFVNWEATPKNIDEVKQTYLGQLHERMLLGDQNSFTEYASSSIVDELWHSDTYYYGIYKRGGWAFDFSEFLNTYLVKTKYHGWREVKAVNKTQIRKYAIHPSHILQIVEI